MSKPLIEDKFKDMMKHPNRTNWARVFECFKCTEKQARQMIPYLCKFDWIRLSEKVELSENFLRKYKNEIFWSAIHYERYSEEFLREMIDYINWDHCSARGSCSKDFYREFKDKSV